MLQSARESRHIGAELTLLDEALLARECVLDGILKRDDVLLVALIHRLNHRGQRGRFARAGVASNEHEAARQIGESSDDLGKIQRRQRRNLGADGAHGHANQTALHVRIHAVALEARDFVGEVEIEVLLEMATLMFIGDSRQDAPHVLAREHGHFHGLHDGVGAHHRGMVGHEMHVRCVGLICLPQDVIEKSRFNHSESLRIWTRSHRRTNGPP